MKFLCPFSGFVFEKASILELLSAVVRLLGLVMVTEQAPCSKKRESLKQNISLSGTFETEHGVRFWPNLPISADDLCTGSKLI